MAGNKSGGTLMVALALLGLLYAKNPDMLSTGGQHTTAAQSVDQAAPRPAAPQTPTSPDVAEALAKLPELQVRGRAPKTGYTREVFGQAWSDDVTVEGGHNGCDTRSDQLGRQLTNKQYKPNTHNCVVLSGTLHDPYTDTIIEYQRGDHSIDIDHVVALSDAWQKGAQSWDDDKRRNFANDPANLLAVDAAANRQKGDGDAATWLPKHNRCMYLARQVNVKASYGLWVTQAEKDQMEKHLGACL